MPINMAVRIRAPGHRRPSVRLPGPFAPNGKHEPSFWGQEQGAGKSVRPRAKQSSIAVAGRPPDDGGLSTDAPGTRVGSASSGGSAPGGPFPRQRRPPDPRVLWGIDDPTPLAPADCRFVPHVSPAVGLTHVCSRAPPGACRPRTGGATNEFCHQHASRKQAASGRGQSSPAEGAFVLRSSARPQGPGGSASRLDWNCFVRVHWSARGTAGHSSTRVRRLTRVWVDDGMSEETGLCPS